MATLRIYRRPLRGWSWAWVNYHGWPGACLWLGRFGIAYEVPRRVR